MSTLFVITLLLTGCLGGRPIWRQNKSEKALENAKYQLENNRQKLSDKSIGFTYGADWSLALDPEPSRYSIAAKDLTERSLLASGYPDIKTAFDFQRIAHGLVSSNYFSQKEAKVLLDRKDEEVVKLQAKAQYLETKVGEAEDKAKKVAEDNSVLASKYVKWVRLFWGLVWIAGIGFILSMVAKLLPPPYNYALGIFPMLIGGIFKIFHGLFPETKRFAAVVSKETNDIAEKTLSDIIKSVQIARKQYPDIQTNLDPILLSNTDKEISRPKITKVKEILGY
ncbi:MAG: hypothetical protein AABY22_28340 [Nanoarchaeota archaeon]